MCGIAGIFWDGSQPIEAAVRRMTAAMVHRGPDDDGYERRPLADGTAGPCVAFGFRRLSILDQIGRAHV